MAFSQQSYTTENFYFFTALHALKAGATNCINKSFIFFQERLKHREQTIRKYEQELDSLQFRNDQVELCQVFAVLCNSCFDSNNCISIKQLSKRVGILQDELDTASASTKNKNTKVYFQRKSCTSEKFVAMLEEC